MAIVGLGRIASLLEEDAKREKPCTHAGAIMANPACQLIAGVDMAPERRSLFEHRWGISKTYETLKELLRHETPDILHIATHPDSHFELVKQAVHAGVKTLVCEKPLADRLVDAKKIAHFHSSGRIKILTNHERRYSADWRRGREILHSGHLGKLLSLKATLYMGKGRRLLDVLWHDGTHLVDIMAFMTQGTLVHERLLGNLRTKEGTAWLMGRAQLSMRGQIPFCIELGACRDHLVFEVEFSCEQGRLKIGNGVWLLEESGPSTYAENFRALFPSAERFQGPTGYFTNMVADAVACTIDRNLEPQSTALDGLKAIQYLQAVTGGWA